MTIQQRFEFLGKGRLLGFLLALSSTPSVAEDATTQLDSDGISAPTTVSSVNVLSNGADPTGMTDSAPAFRAAMGSNRKVFIPPGHYLLASTETAPCCAFNKAAVLVQGYSNFEVDGYDATIKVADGIALSSAFHFDRDEKFAVHGLTIQGTRSGLSSGQENVAIGVSNGADFAFKDLHLTGNFGGEGAAIAGDWMVEGIFENIKMDAVGQCADVAFLKDVSFRNIQANGAGSTGTRDSVGDKCLSFIDDVPNQSTNATGRNFSETNGVIIENVSESNFNEGVFISSGMNYCLSGNHWSRNPGQRNAKGMGIYIAYVNGGVSSSVGAAPRNIIIDGDVLSDNGSAVPGYGLLINSTAITNSDLVTNVSIQRTTFHNNNETAIDVIGSARTGNIILRANKYSGIKQKSSVGAALASIASHKTSAMEAINGAVTVVNKKRLCRPQFIDTK